MKSIVLFILAVSITSCGRKVVEMEPSSMGIVESLMNKKDIISTKAINDQSCIDDILVNEMNEKEKIKKVLADTDINFCNGSRLRLKIYKMNGGKLRVYGLAQSSMGKLSCLRDGSDFKKVFLRGYEGSLVGEGIKFSLGGHAYTSNAKLIKNQIRKAQFVNFTDVSFSGDIGVFEDNELICNEAL